VTLHIVDTSVVVKWFLPEPHADAAKRLLDPAHELLAPDLVWSEFGNVLWKKLRRGQLERAQARAVLEDLQRYPLRIAAAAPLAGPALEIATDLGRSFYDCLYLALAQREDSALVTADRKFYDAVRGSTLTSRIRWVEG
jgi:predicted nucleic acid-binding protein